MKLNKLTLIVGSILVLAVAIESMLIYKLNQQLKQSGLHANDHVAVADARDQWFHHNQNPLFDLFTDFDDIQNDMEQLFGPFSRNFAGEPRFESLLDGCSHPPALDFKEEDQEYLRAVELPGVEDGEVDVDVEGSQLTIRAETSQQKDSKSSKYTRSERFSGKIARSLSLPPDADTGKLQTSFDEDVLTIRIPKTA